MPTPDFTGLHRLGQVAVRVHDLDRAVTFYRDTLGVPFLFAAPPGLAIFRLGDISLMLTVAESPEFDHPASILYYLVDDVVAVHAVLADRGVAFVDAPHLVHRAPDHELWMCFFRDPDENLLALMARRPIA